MKLYAIFGNCEVQVCDMESVPASSNLVLSADGLRLLIQNAEDALEAQELVNDQE